MLYGEAKEVVMSKDGAEEVVTFTAYGFGRFTSPGKVRYHVSVYYRTISTAKLAFLNNVVGPFEHDSDGQDNLYYYQQGVYNYILFYGSANLPTHLNIFIHIHTRGYFNYIIYKIRILVQNF